MKRVLLTTLAVIALGLSTATARAAGAAPDPPDPPDKVDAAAPGTPTEPTVKTTSRGRRPERRRSLRRPDDVGRGGYIGINPIAPFTAVRWVGGATYVAFLADLQSGLALQGGYFFDSWQALDTRFSVGPINSIYTQWQVHAAYDFYLLDFLKIQNKGLYFGPQLRLWDLVHGPHGIHDFSFVPAVHVGYRAEVRGWYVDVRLTQTIAAVSWSTRPATTTRFGMMWSVYPSVSPVIPTLGINLGYRFGAGKQSTAHG